MGLKSSTIPYAISICLHNISKVFFTLLRNNDCRTAIFFFFNQQINKPDIYTRSVTAISQFLYFLLFYDTAGSTLLNR